MSESQDNSINEVICDCTGTSYGKVADLHAQGYNLDEICRKTGARSGCGGCEWDMASFIHFLETPET